MRLPPPEAKGGIRYVRKWINSLRSFVLKTRVIPVAGWEETDGGLLPPPTGGGGGGGGGCCGLAEGYCSQELDTSFIRDADGIYQEMLESSYAGMTLTEGNDGVFVAEYAGGQWTGNERGLAGVIFETSSGTPTPSTFTLNPLPDNILFSIDGDTYELTLDDSVSAKLSWAGGGHEVFYEGGDIYYADGYAYEKEFSGICEYLGEYTDGINSAFVMET